MPRDSSESRGATSAHAHAVAGVQPEKEFLFGVDVSLVVQVPGFTSVDGDTIHGNSTTEVGPVNIDQQLDVEPKEQEAVHVNTFRQTGVTSQLGCVWGIIWGIIRFSESEF